MTNVAAELHSHSTFSDGAFAPEEVAALCAHHGVEIWSLTDHDTCAGCARAAAAADELGIEFIPGIEVSAYEERSIHILGYGVDPECDVLREFSGRRVAARFDRMERMCDRLGELGVTVDYDDVVQIAGEGSVARPHLAQAMLAAGHVSNIEEAFRRYISPGGPAYIATTWPTVPVAIDIIRQSRGVPVLAHPGIYDRDDDIGQWTDHGLVGIEVAHPRHTDEDQRRYRSVADELGLIPTSSSDYHGPDHLSATHFGQVHLSTAVMDQLREAIAAA